MSGVRKKNTKFQVLLVGEIIACLSRQSGVKCRHVMYALNFSPGLAKECTQLVLLMIFFCKTKSHVIFLASNYEFQPARVLHLNWPRTGMLSCFSVITVTTHSQYPAAEQFRSTVVLKRVKHTRVRTWTI